MNKVKQFEALHPQGAHGAAPVTDRHKVPPQRFASDGETLENTAAAITAPVAP